MSRSNVTVFKPTVGAPSATVQLGGVAGVVSVGDLARVATAQRIPVGVVPGAAAGAPQAASSNSVWQGVPATISFSLGVAANADMGQYLPATFATPLDNSATIALPSGVTYNKALRRYEYDGTGTAGGSNGHVITADDAGDDWATRSNAAGVVVANRLNASITIGAWTIQDATANHVSLDTALKPLGSTGSLKFAILNADTSASGSVSVPFGRTFTDGQTVWFSYRVYFQPQDAYAPWPPANDPSGTATKLSILSRDGNGAAPTSSSTANAVVIQLNDNGGMIAGYNHTNTSNPPWEVNLNNACLAPDVVEQNVRDGGANPVGTNPDDGSAWSACQNDRFRYAALHYSARSSGIQAANVKTGLGDPFSGGFRAYPNEWLTVTVRVVIGHFGSADNRITVWAARENAAYVKLTDVTNILIGTNVDGDYNGLTLLPYVTTRQSGGRQVSSRGGQLSSCFTIWNVSQTHATGSGTLSYNASTQRFTWQAAGDSVGTARGFSVANGFLDLNLISSTGANYLNGRVTVANLPGSNTSETITIGTNRPDTQRNYADVIVSTQAINAPGGSVPV